jgi:hypothetical protein
MAKSISALSKELSALRCKVAALEVILEILVVDALAKADDPARAADAIVKSAFATEKKGRDEFGDDPAASALQVTELISALFDRATARAVQQKNSRRRSSK